MAIDVDRARAETPGAQNRIHFNNAGAALQPMPVIETVRAHLLLESEIGGYEAESAAEEKLNNTYISIAHFLNCSPREVAIVENATRAWDMAFYAFAFDFKPGDRILTSCAEYASNYIPYLQVALRTGIKIEVVPDDGMGQLDVHRLRDALDDRSKPPAKLISITHVPTNGGLVNPAEAVGALARAHHVPFLLDACQSVGQMPIDVQKLQVTALSATARKYLRGPRGVGFLYVRSEWLDRLLPPFLDLHAATWIAADQYEIRPDARRFENWECNIAAKLGLGAAVDYASAWGLDNIQESVTDLASALRDRLQQIPGVVTQDRGETKCGIVSFTLPTQQAYADIRDELRRRGINVSVSTASSTRLDMDQRGLSEVIRASVHYYNTREEIDRFANEISNILSG